MLPPYPEAAWGQRRREDLPWACAGVCERVRACASVCGQVCGPCQAPGVSSKVGGCHEGCWVRALPCEGAHLLREAGPARDHGAKAEGAWGQPPPEGPQLLLRACLRLTSRPPLRAPRDQGLAQDSSGSGDDPPAFIRVEPSTGLTGVLETRFSAQ